MNDEIKAWFKIMATNICVIMSEEKKCITCIKYDEFLGCYYNHVGLSNNCIEEDYEYWEKRDEK